VKQKKRPVLLKKDSLAPARYQRATLNGVECVVVTYDAIVSIGQLRANLERFKIEEALAHKKVQETEEMLAQVAVLAPDLLAASDAHRG